MDVINLTRREIILKRLNHEGTENTPYTVSFEPMLYERLTEYYKDEDWERKKLDRYMCGYLSVDTLLTRRIDDVYSIDGFGSLWRMDKKPWHLETPALQVPDLANFKFPDSEDFVSGIRERKEKAAADYAADPEHFRLINMGWGIFEHSWRVRGFEDSLTDMILEEDFYAELTTRIADIYVKMVKECEDVPADAMLFGDDWGDQRGLIMGPDKWRKFIKPCWERIYKEVHLQGKKVMQHSCGSIADIYDDLVEIGLDCHESAQPEARGMAPHILKEKWGDRLSFWGCLGSQSVLHSGTSSEIKNEILRLRDLFKEDGGYILAPAKPLTDEMQIDSAVAVVETLSELNAKYN
jgi:uroporphyrinogen decarboxylase